ncbi:hypothetical protein GGF46_004832 [Coemansia sp. RSA 552]|nr:hypothetical protein GGF46_004832 [Coemansia sp. RSA 552]
MPVWDSVLLDMVGNNTGVNVPVDLKPAPDRRNKDRRSTHIYQADVVLRDADTYRPQGYLEFRDAQWNPDDGGTPQLVPEDLTVVDWMKVTVVDDGQSPYNLKRYPGLPLCTEMDMDGRWVPAASLPFSPSLVPTADHHGLVWLPYDCRLRNIPYRNFVKDLTETNKLVHWFGDNNMQRSAKKITSLGAWCSRPRSLTQKSICYCDDAKERFSKYNVDRQETVVELTMSGGGRSIATQRFSTKDIRGGRARMVLFKMDGLSDRLQPGRKKAGNKEPNWKQRFESGMVRRLGSPSMVIVSLSNWGPALSTRTSFIQDLHLLVTHLKSTYVSGIKVVLRTGQYFCCRSDPMGSKYRNSRLRDRSFDNLIISTFRQTLGNVFDIRVWDVARISERRPHAFRLEDPRCLTNYSPSDIVDVENQVLFNHLANSRLLLD